MDHNKKNKQKSDEEFSRHLGYAENFPETKSDDKEAKKQRDNKPKIEKR